MTARQPKATATSRQFFKNALAQDLRTESHWLPRCPESHDHFDRVAGG